MSDLSEGKKLERAKKAVATGMTVANLYTAGDVASRAAQGEGHPVKDMVSMASVLPGAKGWAAYAADKTRAAYDYTKSKTSVKEDKNPCWKGYQMVGMKKKGARKVPNCVPVNEKISDKTPLKNVIHDFVHSDNKTFSGDSKKQRIKRALGAYYAMHENHLDESNKVNKQKKHDWHQSTKKPKKKSDEKWDPRDMLSGLHRGRKVAEEIAQIDELSAELVGKVHNKRLEKGQVPSKTLRVAVKKKWLESNVGKLKKEETEMNEAKASWEKEGNWSKMMKRQEREFFKGKNAAEKRKKAKEEKERNKTASSETKVNENLFTSVDMIDEAITNIFEGKLDSMRTHFKEALTVKINEALDERKKIIAENYFAQHQPVAE